MSDAKLRQDLCEVIAALDARTPQVGREGELAIAADAQSLRAQALERLAELNRANLVVDPAPSPERPTTQADRTHPAGTRRAG